MADATQPPAAEGQPLNAAPKPAQPLPDLTKETWEYLELRLWSSFSKKLWVILSAVLTIAALLGLLGMSAWLDAKVQAALAKQTEAFEAARKAYVDGVARQLMTTTLLFTLESRLRVDTVKYIEQSSRVYRSLTPEQLKVLQSKPAIAPLFLMHTPGLRPFADFRTQYNAARKELNLPERNDFELLSDDIASLTKAAGHLLALKQTVSELRTKVGTEVAVDPRMVEAVYESQLLPTYTKELSRLSGHASFSSTREEDVSSLPRTAKVAFPGLFEPAAK